MILAIIVFILIFSFLVLGHELGHFLAARKIGVRVEEFGIGFPPRIWGKKIGETLYSVNWIPFGGFVRILGEDRGEEGNKESLSSRGPGQKAFVLLSGVAFNFLIAIIVFGLLVSVHGFKTYQASFDNKKFNILIDRIKKLNKEISEDESLGKGFCIGHSYFCNQKECSECRLSEIVKYDILPMLTEYWFDDSKKIRYWEKDLQDVFND